MIKPKSMGSCAQHVRIETGNMNWTWKTYFVTGPHKKWSGSRIFLLLDGLDTGHYVMCTHNRMGMLCQAKQFRKLYTYSVQWIIQTYRISAGHSSFTWHGHEIQNLSDYVTHGVIQTTKSTVPVRKLVVSKTIPVCCKQLVHMLELAQLWIAWQQTVEEYSLAELNGRWSPMSDRWPTPPWQGWSKPEHGFVEGPMMKNSAKAVALHDDSNMILHICRIPLL